MSRRSTLLLGPLSTILALLLMTALPQPAQAYTQRTYVTVAQGSSYCVQATAGIDHLTPGVWSANQAWGAAYALEADCVTPKVMQARVSVELWQWDGSHWHWFMGGAGYWMEGKTGSDAWGPTGPGYGMDYTSVRRLGGPGWYRTKVEAQVSVWDPFAARYIWKGGTLYSGDEWVE
ncbi:hypothetical protein ACQP10_19070 [Streptosporangium sandarakinum]|uniref:hypothetical protein n=1 Tax=Streptosporangium sandarakinum TaxID=1260955 RepID=UPI003D8B0FFB